MPKGFPKSGVNKGWFKRGEKSAFFDRIHKEETKTKMSLLKVNERNPNWKGTQVSYDSLHAWIYRKLGMPSTCEFCGQSSEDYRKINWANKSGEHKRELSDWIRLCKSCHNKYDNLGKNQKRNKRGQYSK